MKDSLPPDEIKTDQQITLDNETAYGMLKRIEPKLVSGLETAIRGEQSPKDRAWLHVLIAGATQHIRDDADKPATPQATKKKKRRGSKGTKPGAGPIPPDNLLKNKGLSDRSDVANLPDDKAGDQPKDEKKPRAPRKPKVDPPPAAAEPKPDEKIDRPFAH